MASTAKASSRRAILSRYLRVVAEGIETEYQARVLRAVGCSVYQGYYYGLPMPTDDFSQLLAAAGAKKIAGAGEQYYSWQSNLQAQSGTRTLLMRISFILCVISLLCATALTAAPSRIDPSPFSPQAQVFGAEQTQWLWLAGADGGDATTPESGTLVIPGEDQDQEKKQCLNVCKKWGEACIINPRTGTRSCRKTCKEFGEECF